jgi:hypothetical protein
MRSKVELPSFEGVLNILSGLGFDVRKVPEVANQVFVEKYGAGAILARNTMPRHPAKVPVHPMVWGERPGLVVGDSIATLLDRGYQKFWKTARGETPATAVSLKAVHRFAEELREAIGEPSLYNESLGTTSDIYLYDRVQGRDLPPADRPKPAWNLPSGEASAPSGNK